MPQIATDATAAMTRISARTIGIVLIAATLLQILAMAHHPSVASRNISEVLGQIAAASQTSAWVHGALIGLLLVVLFVYADYCRRRGIGRPLVSAGLIAYGAGIAAMIVAAMMSGFVIARVAAAAPNVASADLQVSAQLLNFTSTLNQVFANTGAILMSVGIVAWSADLLLAPRIARPLAILGLLIGFVPAAALAMGLLHLDVQGMTWVVLLQAVWNIGVGVVLIRGADINT